MDRQSERPPTHLSAHSMKCSDAAAAALGVGWCFLQALLPLSRSIVLIPLLSADLHKIPNPSKKKKQKKKRNHLSLTMTLRVYWSQLEKSRERKAVWRASRCLFLKQRVSSGLATATKNEFSKGGSILKHCSTQSTVCLRTIDFSLSPHLCRSLDLFKKYVTL